MRVHNKFLGNQRSILKKVVEGWNEQGCVYSAENITTMYPSSIMQRCVYHCRFNYFLSFCSFGEFEGATRSAIPYILFSYPFGFWTFIRQGSWTAFTFLKLETCPFCLEMKVCHCENWAVFLQSPFNHPVYLKHTLLFPAKVPEAIYNSFIMEFKS